MTILTVSEQVWQAPKNRKTWAEVRAACRSATRVRSTTVLTDDELDDCIDRAIDQAWPKAFMHQVFKTGEIEEMPDSITLPWQPYMVWNVTWWDLTNTDDIGGQLIPKEWWEVENDQWRWLGGESNWHSSTNVLWTMNAIGKPRGHDDEGTYCPVQLQQLLPLVHIEVAQQLAAMRGGDPITQSQMLMNQRDQARKNMLRMRIPAHKSKLYICNRTTPVFVNAGQDNITFADLQ
jgi:hypothetical protein